MDFPSPRVDFSDPKALDGSGNPLLGFRASEHQAERETNPLRLRRREKSRKDVKKYEAPERWEAWECWEVLWDLPVVFAIISAA